MRVVLLVLGSLVTGVVLMIWGFAFWTASPFPKMAMSEHPAMTEVAETLLAEEVVTGVYTYPSTEAVQDAKRGPFLEVFFVPDVEYMSARTFAQGYLHMVGSAILAGFLLMGLGASLPTYGSRVSFMFLVGLLAVFALHFSNPIWFHYPWTFAFMIASYDLIFFLLIGLVMGVFIRPSRPALPAGSKPE